MERAREFIESDEVQQYLEWINMKNRNFLEEMLENLVDPASTDTNIEKYGKEIYHRYISFSRFSRLLETFGNGLTEELRLRLQANSDLLAKGYLEARIPREMSSIRHKVHADTAYISREDLQIIEELFGWIHSLLESLQGEAAPPEISARIQAFADFVEAREGTYFQDENIREDFLRTNRELYQTALETLALHQRGEYYYGTLVYIEMVALFLKMATLLNSMFLQEELMSIYIDPITRLPNRLQLIRDLGDFRDAYILILNVNAFSKLNLFYGYDFGDEVLRRIAESLEDSIARRSYRIYGDEFAAIVGSEAEVKELFERLNRSISVLGEERIFDIYFYGAYKELGGRALEVCEFALQKNRDRTLIDSQEIEELMSTLKHELSLLQELRDALERDAVIPFFQPIYSPGERRVVGYEALMRIERPREEGIMEPKTFLEVLLESPYYLAYTRRMLEKCFDFFADKPDLFFNVNFTLKDFRDPDITQYLDELVTRDPETARRLTIEIVESEALRDFEAINRFILHFRPRGIRFALDDFGSGYSNFIQCARLEIDDVKIDGSIVEQSLEDPKMGRLLESIIEFAHSFGISTIAEYVSSKELFESLQDRVDRIQGYYIGRPSPDLVR